MVDGHWVTRQQQNGSRKGCGQQVFACCPLHSVLTLLLMQESCRDLRWMVVVVMWGKGSMVQGAYMVWY